LASTEASVRFEQADKMFRLIALLLAFGLIFGCSGAPEKKYIPSADAARTTLETALEHWKSGAKHGRIDDKIAIDVFDARWQNGRKLESYEILDEEISEGPKIFVVKMKLDEDKQEKEVKYYIVGKNPLMVFREQDYQKASGTGG
jgi:hypothetical protein